MIPPRPNHTLRRTLALGALVFTAASIGAGLVVYAQQQGPLRLMQQEPAATAPARPAPPARERPAQAQQGAQKPAAPAPAQPATVFEEHARQAKMTTCAQVFAGLGRALAADSTYTAQTQWDTKTANAHSVQSLVALSGGGNNPGARAAGVVFAAPLGQTCEGTLVRVTPTEASCQALAADLLKINGQKGALGELELVALPNGAQVMLVPFGNACIAVSTMRAAAAG